MTQNKFLIILLSTLRGVALGAGADLEKDFTNPPETTRPRCKWHWMDGHISKEKIMTKRQAFSHNRFAPYSGITGFVGFYR